MQMFRHRVAQAAALVLLGAAAAGVHAQSNVKIYGLLDAGIEYNTGGAPGEKSVWRMNTGNQAGTRLGFLVNEDLGGGLMATANIEMGYYVDTGSVITYGEPNGTFWGRRSVAGLRSNTWGEVVLGRDYTPAFWTVIQTDRFRYGLPGTVSTPSGIVVTRANKGVFWTSPKLGGLTARAMVAASDATVPRDHMVGGSLDYKAGNLFLSFAAQKRGEPASKPNTGVKEFGGGAEYSFSPFVVTAGFWSADPDVLTSGAVDKSKAFWIGAGYDVPLGQINLQVTQTKVDIVGNPTQGKALTYGLSYTYLLSKSTALYTGVGRVSNDANARLALNSGSQRAGGTVFGSDPRSIIAGMRTSF